MPSATDAVANASAVGDANIKTKIKGKSLSKEDFTKIFLAQLQAQNPLKPMDNTQMMQQMSTMTSLDSTQELQETIKSLNVNMGKSQVFEATQLMGKKVRVFSNYSPLDAKDGLTGSVVLSGPANDITVHIQDKDGKEVKTLKLDPAGSAGVLDFHWDGHVAGKEGEEIVLPPDNYKISVDAKNNGKDVETYTGGTFSVSSVAFNQKTGGVIINVDHGVGGVDMSDIIKILPV